MPKTLLELYEDAAYRVQLKLLKMKDKNSSAYKNNKETLALLEENIALILRYGYIPDKEMKKYFGIEDN